jgi:hypothetical protein
VFIDARKDMLGRIPRGAVAAVAVKHAKAAFKRARVSVERHASREPSADKVCILRTTQRIHTSAQFLPVANLHAG